MGKVYSKLVESFGYLTEAPGDQNEPVSFVSDKPAGDPSQMTPGEIRYAPGYDPNAKSDTTDTPTDTPTDQPKPTPTSKYNANPGTKAYQHWLNIHGIKVAIDGKYGPQTMSGGTQFFEKLKKTNPSNLGPEKYNDFNKYKLDQANYERLFKEFQEMQGAGTAHNVRPGGGMSLNSPQYLDVMKRYGYDPKTGDPIPGFKNPNADLWATFDKQSSGQGSQPGRATGALPTKQETLILKSLDRLEPIFKKYGVQAECTYKDDGSLLTEDDWVLKHIDLFTEQEKMEIWKIISEAELTPFGTVGADIAARRRAGELDQRIAKAQANMADRAAQNAPQQQSKLAKFGRNLGTKFGLGGGKRAALKGAAKFGLRAIPFIGTAVLLWDVGSALYDTFANTEMADIDPADQEIIAQEIQNLTQMSKSADYNNVSEETKKRVTAILNAANKLAQQAA